MDFDQGVPKYCIQLPQLPNYPNKYKYGKQIFEKLEINPKNLLGVFAQVKIGLKKILSQEEFFFIKGTFCANTPKQQKNGSKSEKYKFTNIFTRFFQCGQFLLKGFKQNSMNQKVKVTFSLKMRGKVVKSELDTCNGP